MPKTLFFGIRTLFNIICPVGLIFKLVLLFINEVLIPSVFLSIMNPFISFLLLRKIKPYQILDVFKFFEFFQPVRQNF